MYAPLQGVVGLLCRLRHPSRTPAFWRLWSWLVSRDSHAVSDFPNANVTDDRTVSGLRHAGWFLETTRVPNSKGTPTTIPFGPGGSTVCPCCPSRRSHAGFSRPHGFRVRQLTTLRLAVSVLGQRASHLVLCDRITQAAQPLRRCPSITPLRAICYIVKWRTSSWGGADRRCNRHRSVDEHDHQGAWG